MQQALRPSVAAGVALVGAGVIAVTPVTVPLADIHVPGIQLTAGEDITLDLVRHGQSTDNVNDILGTTPPGAHLTDVGEQQAHDVAPVIQGEFPNGIDGIYASELVRTQETAAPLADLLHMNVHILPGLNEINAGILEGTQLGRLGELLYIAVPFLWTLGFEGLPQWGSTIDPNGFTFDARFSDAVNTIYDNTVTSPDAPATDVAFSHAAAIMVWTMMNVKNPDPLLIFTDPLDNTGQVVIHGNPEDGWTLVSWNGTDIDPDPDLGTAMFVDFRDLIVALQSAFDGVEQAFLAGDPTTIVPAAQAGLDDVGTAITQFSESVYNDIVNALADAGSGGAAAVTGDTAATLGDALASVI